jgi:hypothetical protein
MATRAPATARIRAVGEFTVVRDGMPASGAAWGNRTGRTMLMLLVVERGRLVPIDRVATPSAGRSGPLAQLTTSLLESAGSDTVAARI